MNKEIIRGRLGLMTPQDFHRQRVLPNYEKLRLEQGQEAYEEVVAGGVGSGKTTEMLLDAAEFLTTDANDDKCVCVVAATTGLAARYAADLKGMLRKLGRLDAVNRVRFSGVKLLTLHAASDTQGWEFFRDHYRPHNPKPMDQSPTPPPQRT